MIHTNAKFEIVVTTPLTGEEVEEFEDKLKQCLIDFEVCGTIYSDATGNEMTVVKQDLRR